MCRLFMVSESPLPHFKEVVIGPIQLNSTYLLKKHFYIIFFQSPNIVFSSELRKKFYSNFSNFSTTSDAFQFLFCLVYYAYANANRCLGKHQSCFYAVYFNTHISSHEYLVIIVAINRNFRYCLGLCCKTCLFH
jgi:hypothetical protein